MLFTFSSLFRHQSYLVTMMASLATTNDNKILPDRLGFTFLEDLESQLSDFSTIKLYKKTDINYLLGICFKFVKLISPVFLYMQDEATHGNKDFLADKGLFLYAIAKLLPQETPGIISITNEQFCTLLAGIACVRVKSNKGSTRKAEKPQQTDNNLLWQFNDRIDKVVDCLSKYFNIKQIKEEENGIRWTLTNPFIGYCVVHFDQEKLSQMLLKFTPATKPGIRGAKVDPAEKKSKLKSESIKSSEQSEELEDSAMDDSPMHGDYRVPQHLSYPVYQYSNPTPQMWGQNQPPGMHPGPNPPNIQSYNNHVMAPMYNQVHHFEPMTQIERDTGVPQHVWNMIEEKARKDPMILLKMINTLVPLADRVKAMQQQGQDPKTLFDGKN